MTCDQNQELIFYVKAPKARLEINGVIHAYDMEGETLLTVQGVLSPGHNTIRINGSRIYHLITSNSPLVKKKTPIEAPQYTYTFKDSQLYLPKFILDIDDHRVILLKTTVVVWNQNDMYVYKNPHIDLKKQIHMHWKPCDLGFDTLNEIECLGDVAVVNNKVIIDMVNPKKCQLI